MLKINNEFYCKDVTYTAPNTIINFMTFSTKFYMFIYIENTL